MIREEAKMLKGIKLSRGEINEYRKKKLIEVRKGTGAGRPIQFRCKSRGTFLNHFTQNYMNECRDKQFQLLKQKIKSFILDAN